MGTTPSAATPTPHFEVSQPRYFAGADVGGTEVKVVIVEVRDSVDPKIVDRSDFGAPSEVSQGPEHVTGNVIPNALRASLDQAQVSPKLIEGLGADFPAPVNARGGTVLDIANLKHLAWPGARVREGWTAGVAVIEGFSPKIIAVDNDGAAAMYSLTHELPVSDRRKGVFGLFIGTGVGGAAQENAKNLFNNEGGGTEPGATFMSFDEQKILLGQSGSFEKRKLEEYVSLTAIERQLQILHRVGAIPENHPLLDLQSKGDKNEWRVRAEKVISFGVEALQQEKMDDFSLRLFRVQQGALGMYLATIIQANRPSHIFIGGGVADPRRASEQFRKWYLDGIEAAARDNIHQELRKTVGFPKFHMPADGDFAAPKGAALMAARLLGAVGKKRDKR